MFSCYICREADRVAIAGACAFLVGQGKHEEGWKSYHLLHVIFGRSSILSWPQPQLQQHSISDWHRRRRTSLELQLVGSKNIPDV